MALDWLNEHTGEGIRFFGVVIRAVRIGDSAPAPLLELAVQPNDWQKSVRRVAAPRESAEVDAYRTFWEPVKERLLRVDPTYFKGRAKPRSIWLTMNSPIHQTFLAGEIGAGEIRVVLDIDTGTREQNLALLNALRSRRSAIEAEAGELDFSEGNVRCKVIRRLPWDGKLLTQPDRHEEARNWLCENMLGLRRGLDAVAPLHPASE